MGKLEKKFVRKRLQVFQTFHKFRNIGIIKFAVAGEDNGELDDPDTDY